MLPAFGLLREVGLHFFLNGQSLAIRLFGKVGMAAGLEEPTPAEVGQGQLLAEPQRSWPVNNEFRTNGQGCADGSGL